MILPSEDSTNSSLVENLQVVKSLNYLKEAFFYTLDRLEINFGPGGLFSATTCREVMIWCAFDAPTHVDDVTYLQCILKVCRSLSRDFQSHNISIFWSALSQIMDLRRSQNLRFQVWNFEKNDIFWWKMKFFLSIIKWFSYGLDTKSNL